MYAMNGALFTVTGRLCIDDDDDMDEPDAWRDSEALDYWDA